MCHAARPLPPRLPRLDQPLRIFVLGHPGAAGAARSAQCACLEGGYFCLIIIKHGPPRLKLLRPLRPQSRAPVAFIFVRGIFRGLGVMEAACGACRASRQSASWLKAALGCSAAIKQKAVALSHTKDLSGRLGLVS